MAMTQTMLRNFLDLDLCIVNSQSHDQALCVPIFIRRAALNPEANKQRVWAIGLSATTSLESHLDTPADKPKPTLGTDELAFMRLLLWVGFPSSSHRPRSEIKYQQKTHSVEVLNLFLSKDHKTTLTFCQVIILLYTSSRLTKSSTLFSTPVSVSTQRVPLVVF